MRLPERLFLEITKECNLKCRLCKLWEQKDPSGRLLLEDKIKFLLRLFNWLENYRKNFRNHFCIILTGGEPFLYTKEILKIAEICKDNNIKCYVNSNGSLLELTLNRIFNCGLSALTISIDSHIPEIHDKLRNSPGLFSYLTDKIKRMVQWKKENNFLTKICVQSILGSWNLNSILDHISFFYDLGIDGIMFQPIQYPFGLSIPENWHKKFLYFPKLSSEIANSLEILSDFKKENDFIMHSREEIELWKLYFDNPEYLPKQINPCKSYEQNLIVDTCGNVKFCFNKLIEPINKIGNIKTHTIDELWKGKTAFQIRESMKTCNRACGVMACHIDTKLRVE
ncbi:MAG: radical SAM/SPASM domain-containing protein [Promethearchaeota archaeon]